MTVTVEAAPREAYVAAALDAAIRARVVNRAWYRAHRSSFQSAVWQEWERDNNIVLRQLLSVRREAMRLYGRGRLHADRMAAALYDASEGESFDPPRAYLQDAGDHHIYPAGRVGL